MLKNAGTNEIFDMAFILDECPTMAIAIAKPIVQPAPNCSKLIEHLDRAKVATLSS